MGWLWDPGSQAGSHAPRPAPSGGGSGSGSRPKRRSSSGTRGTFAAERRWRRGNGRRAFGGWRIGGVGNGWDVFRRSRMTRARSLSPSTDFTLGKFVALDDNARRSTRPTARGTIHPRRSDVEVSESGEGMSGSETRSWSVRMACLCRPPCILASHIGGVLVRGAEVCFPGNWTISRGSAEPEGSMTKRIWPGRTSGRATVGGGRAGRPEEREREREGLR